MKIENVLFDFGQVLVRFDPDYIVGQYVSDPADRDLLVGILFDRYYWDRLDDGSIGEEDVIADTREKIPERLREAAENAMRYWYRQLPEIPGMREVVEKLLSAGKRVCLLSNISKTFAAHADEIPILSGIGERVFSSTCGMTKPDPAIFRYTCAKFGLVPEETLFVDDRPSNIDGAENAGLRGYLFDGDAEKLSHTLATIL